MDNEFNFITAAEQIATHLRDVAHTPQQPRFFTAFGIEDLYNLDDTISAVTGKIVIAVDSYEIEDNEHGGDAIPSVRTYTLIIAGPTASDRPETIRQVTDAIHPLIRQARAWLLQASDTISRTTHTQGIGPIGDNYYGLALTLTAETYPDTELKPEYWI